MEGVKFLSKADVARLSVLYAGLSIIDWKYYDTLPVLNGGTQSVFTFFQQAKGQGGATLETTNLDIPSQLQKKYMLVLQQIRLVPIPALSTVGTAAYKTDQSNMSEIGYAEFKLANRNFYECPALDLVGGGFIGFTGIAATMSSIQRNPVNGKLEYSPVIPDNTAFNLSVTYPQAPVVTANSRLRCEFIGKLIRPGTA